MADTGAPWNIPYVSPTDNPRVYPAADEAQALAIAAGLSAAGSEGIGPNVVQTVKTDTFVTSSASFVTVTGLTATITPSSDTSKVLVIAQVGFGGANGSGLGAVKVTRAGTDIYVGAPDGSRMQGVFGGFNFADNSSNVYSMSVVYLDSPGVDSATEYRVEARRGGTGSCHINRSTADANNNNEIRTASSITVIEVQV